MGYLLHLVFTGLLQKSQFLSFQIHLRIGGIFVDGIKEYMDDLTGIYGTDIETAESSYTEIDLSKVPDVLREFYGQYEKVQFPFGNIYSIETAIKQSKAEPFHSQGWFCFGQDNYFSFWLCKYQPDEENLSFTAWDHESGSEIDGAVYETLEEFLKDMQDEYEDYENFEEE